MREADIPGGIGTCTQLARIILAGPCELAVNVGEWDVYIAFQEEVSILS